VNGRDSSKWTDEDRTKARNQRHGMHIIERTEKESKKSEEGNEESPKFKALGVNCQVLNRLLGTPDLWYCESYVYWTVHHLYSCVKRKNQLDATYFII